MIKHLNLSELKTYILHNSFLCQKASKYNFFNVIILFNFWARTSESAKIDCSK